MRLSFQGQEYLADDLIWFSSIWLDSDSWCPIQFRIDSLFNTILDSVKERWPQFFGSTPVRVFGKQFDLIWFDLIRFELDSDSWCPIWFRINVRFKSTIFWLYSSANQHEDISDIWMLQSCNESFIIFLISFTLICGISELLLKSLIWKCKTLHVALSCHCFWRPAFIYTIQTWQS